MRDRTQLAEKCGTWWRAEEGRKSGRLENPGHRAPFTFQTIRHHDLGEGNVFNMSSMGQKPASVTYAAAMGINAAITNIQIAKIRPNILVPPSAFEKGCRPPARA